MDVGVGREGGEAVGVEGEFVAELIVQMAAVLHCTLYIYLLRTYRTNAGPEVQCGERVVSFGFYLS